MKNWGIHKRVLFITIAPAVVISVLLLAYHIYLHATSLEQQFSSKGNLLAKRIASASEYAVLTGNADEILNIVRPAMTEEDVIAVTIESASGKMLLEETNDTPTREKFRKVFHTPILQTAIELDDATGNAVGPVQENTTLGQVTVILSTKATLEKRNRAILDTTGITMAGLLAGILLALRIGRSVSNPILQLGDTVRAIGKQQLDTRVQLEVGGELGELGNGINEMASELEELHNRMQAKIDVATSVLIRTIGELEAKNEALDDARLEALQASRAKSEFLGNISHEILTPMNSIVGYNELLTRTEDPIETARYHRTIRESSQSLMSIVNNLLDFSRIDTGQLVLASVDFNLREILEDVVIALSDAAFSKDLELILLFYDDVPVLLRGDPSRIKQLLSTFVENAIKFTEQGSITIRVMQEENTTDHAIIRISISDTGIGIDQSAMDRVMEAFSQADLSTTKKYSGLGLGLVIARKLIEKMAGDVSFDSTPGKGTTFRFSMRLDKQGGAGATDTTVSTIINTLYKNILVCDPNPASMNSIVHALRGVCSNIQQLPEYTELASLVNRQAQEGETFEIVIMAISADDISNGSLIPVFNAIDNRDQYTFIAMLGSSNQVLHQQARAQGFDLCIPKTFRKKDLQYLVTHAATAGAIDETDALPAAAGDNPHYLTSLRVLIADDNAINRTLLKTLLGSHGIHCTEAEDGEIAVAKALSHSYDLIFMDIHMPVLNGIDAAKQIRERERTLTRTPIIAVTANRTPEIYNQILAAGMEDCIVKPILDEKLMDIIHKWIAIRELAPAEIRGAGAAAPPAAENASPPLPTPHADPAQYSGFDHALAMRITAGNQQLANDLFRMFLEDIPELQAQLNRAMEQRDIAAATSSVHQIHGAAAYCAVPGIKAAAHTLEKALLHNPSEVHAPLLAELNRHIDTLLQQNSPPADHGNS